MSLVDAVRVLNARWVFFVEQNLSIPTAYDNMQAPAPNPTTNLWARVSVKTGRRDILELHGGGSNNRRIGTMIAQLFGPLDVGLNGVGVEQLQAAEDIETQLTNKTFSGVVTRVAWTELIGRTKDDFQINIYCPFQFDEID